MLTLFLIVLYLAGLRGFTWYEWTGFYLFFAFMDYQYLFVKGVKDDMLHGTNWARRRKP